MYESKIVYLDLPPVPEDLKNAVKEVCEKITFSSDRLSRVKSYYSKDMPAAAQEYDTEQVPPLDKDIILEFRKIYGDIFTGGIVLALGAAKCLSDSPAVTPPHCDRIRRVAINMLLDTGGDRVVTTLYKQTRQGHDLSAGENLDYDKVDIIDQQVVPQDTWYAFDAQRYHSVENITSTRYYLSLSPLYNLEFSEFIKKYHYLVKSE